MEEIMKILKFYSSILAIILYVMANIEFCKSYNDYSKATYLLCMSIAMKVFAMY